MAYRQPYRGNPELKQYHLINDFSGGLDTVSLDEKMRDNEFREMNNIELALQGSISNRKGFGELDNFNQWLEDNSSPLLTGKTTLFKILKSDKPVLKWAHDYVDYDAFSSRMESEIYELKILMATQNGSNINFRLVTVANSDGTANGVFTDVDDVLVVPGTLKDKYNINTFQYVQKIYFLSYDVYETANANYKGIMVFDLDESTLTVLKPSDTYLPTPYEVESFGFNVLRENPLTDVATQGFGDFSIIGFYLTDTQGRYIEKIPAGGDFNLIAFQIGEDMYPQHIVLTIKDQNDRVLTYNLETVTDGGGYFTYPIRNLLLSNVTTVTFEFTTNETIVDGYKATENTSFNPLSYQFDGYEYHFGSWDEFFSWTSFPSSDHDVVIENFKLVPNTPVLNPNISITTADDKISIYRELILSNLQFYIDPVFNSIIRVDTGAGYAYYKVVDSGLTKRLFQTTITADENFIITPTLYTGTVSQQTIFQAQDDLYYGYIGDVDFEDAYISIGEPQDITTFTSSANIGTNEDVESTEPLDLDGAKITQIQDRMVFYKGNSIYFSEQFQYDYVPNLNYVLLPIKSTDEITHINFYRGVYIVFTKESIWRFSGTVFGPDFVVTKINDFIGCIAPSSVRALNNNLMFLSRQGLYVLTQSYYQEGLENVKKVDDKVQDLVELDEEAYAVMYKDQYWLVTESENYDTLKYYFNVDKPNGGHPFVTDTYKVKPDNLENYNGVLYSIKNGHLYRFDRGYTDFLPRNSNSSVIPDYMYNYRFVTKNDDLGYPTHDKKIKSVYFKIRTEDVAQLGVTIFVNEKAVIDPNSYEATVNEYGEVIYNTTFDYNLEVDPQATLGDFVLGKDMLGKTEVQIHKFLVSKKAKNISIAIEQSTNGYFNIEDIGYLFKLGKVKETSR